MPNLPAMLLEAPLQRTIVTDALMLLGLGLIGLVVVLHLRRYRLEAGGAGGGGAGGAGGAGLTPREQMERARQERALEGQLGEVMTGLEQAAQKLGAELDAKAARLEKLMAEADGRMARLEELTARAEAAARAGAPAAAMESPESAGFADGPGAGGAGAFGAATAMPGADAVAPPRRGGPTPLPPAPGEEPVDPVTRCVYELADKGLEPMAIARQLDQHIGKVELILALREV
jgi:hypothetical protein